MEKMNEERARKTLEKSLISEQKVISEKT